MVTCVVYASDGSVQPTATAPSLLSHSRRCYTASSSTTRPSSADSTLSHSPLPSQLAWEQTDSEYVEYRSIGQQLDIPYLLTVDSAQRQQLCPPLLFPSNFFPVGWRALLTAVAARLPPLFLLFTSTDSSDSDSDSEASMPLSSVSSASLSTPFSYRLFDPYAVYFVSDSCSSSLGDSTLWSHFFRNLVHLLSVPLWLYRVWPVVPLKAHSACSSLCRSMAVCCAAILLGALATSCCWRWCDESGEHVDSVSVSQSVYLQLDASAAGVAVPSSPSPSVGRLDCSYAAFACCSPGVSWLNGSSAMSALPTLCRSRT